MLPYEPSELPIKNLDYARLISLVGEANAQLARYDGLLQGLVNPAIMLSPLTVEEAVLSSKIEGTQATVDEVLEFEAGMIPQENKKQDINEVANYRRALKLAQQHLKGASITLSFVKSLHKILMDSVRGMDKMPGEFRNSQNWIGARGSSIEEATFVPPNSFQLPNYLEEWEKYLSFNDVDTLIQAAIVHAQFELLHPFKDGNGRLGRILIPLFLFQKKKLSEPMFYLSAYLDSNREKYYLSLNNISKNGDWNGWIEFFLNAIVEQSQNNIRKVKEIMSLYDSMKEKIQKVTHSQYTITILDAIFSRPIFKSSDFISFTGIAKPTAMNLLVILKKENILKEIAKGGGRRPSIICFHHLLSISEGKQI